MWKEMENFKINLWVNCHLMMNTKIVKNKFKKIKILKKMFLKNNNKENVKCVKKKNLNIHAHHAKEKPVL